MADEEPSLPRLPAVSWDEPSQSFSNQPRKRARTQRLNHALPPSLCNSSDPAVFSSDDDPGLDNYVEGRRKKRYVGSWFQQQPASSDPAIGEPKSSPRKLKRKLTRKVDSGIFLGSDETESDCPVEVPTKSRLPVLDRAHVPRVSAEEAMAREEIQACLDQGKERIMLWSMGLESICNETIEPLTQFTLVPLVVKDVAFEQRDPEIKLNLGANRLSRVPGAIFDITHLSALTLRGNQLQDLPQGISKLLNLKELNLSQNRLRYLPVELLDLVESSDHLHNLSLHPNPFLQPRQSPDCPLEPELSHHTATLNLLPDENAKLRLNNPALLSRHVARSPVQVSNSSGRVLSTFKLPSASDSCAVQVHPSTPQQNSATSESWGSSPVPSLFEVAMRKCIANDKLEEMRDCLPEYFAPLRDALQRSIELKEAGGMVCSRCRKQIAAPAVQWIEWRELATYTKLPGEQSVTAGAHSRHSDEWAVPFLHRGCSLRCGPPKQEETSWRLGRGTFAKTDPDLLPVIEVRSPQRN